MQTRIKRQVDYKLKLVCKINFPPIQDDVQLQSTWNQQKIISSKDFFINYDISFLEVFYFWFVMNANKLTMNRGMHIGNLY